MQDKNLIKQKEKYSLICFWSCVIAFIATILGLSLRIIFEFIEGNKYVQGILGIIDLVINFVAIIIMIISYVKFKKLERIIAKNETENNENKQM